jgi:C1A family cysteine protease
MENNIKVRRLNVLPYNKDSRDHVYKVKNTQVSDVVDLREYDSNIEDQGNIGSCVSSSLCNAYEIMVKKLYPNTFKELSRLFVYYHSRLFDDSLEDDLGSYIRDGLKSLKNYGVCSEELWPYNLNNFDMQPPPECYLNASKRTITEYQLLLNNEEIVEVLSNNVPVTISIEIFQDFNNVNKDNNVVKIPNSFDYSLGYHAVLLLGYNLNTRQFLMKNSWGSSWGDNGYAYIPFQYVSTFSKERWVFDISTQSTTLI